MVIETVVVADLICDTPITRALTTESLLKEQAISFMSHGIATNCYIASLDLVMCSNAHPIGVCNAREHQKTS